jgi:hypothetical protein
VAASGAASRAIPALARSCCRLSALLACAWLGATAIRSPSAKASQSPQPREPNSQTSCSVGQSSKAPAGRHVTLPGAQPAVGRGSGHHHGMRFRAFARS